MVGVAVRAGAGARGALLRLFLAMAVSRAPCGVTSNPRAGGGGVRTSVRARGGVRARARGGVQGNMVAVRVAAGARCGAGVGGIGCGGGGLGTGLRVLGAESPCASWRPGVCVRVCLCVYVCLCVCACVSLSVSVFGSVRWLTSVYR